VTLLGEGAWAKEVTAVAGMEEPKLPKFDYYLDESDPDVVILRRQDGAFVAAFSARGQPGRVSLRPPKRTTVSSCCVCAHARSRNSP
jgi:hypothetical protein